MERGAGVVPLLFTHGTSLGAAPSSSGPLGTHTAAGRGRSWPKGCPCPSPHPRFPSLHVSCAQEGTLNEPGTPCYTRLGTVSDRKPLESTCSGHVYCHLL